MPFDLKRHSVVERPRTSTTPLQVQKIVNAYKSMFHLNELSRISDPTLKASVDQTEKLSLGQAKYLSSLHNLTMRKTLHSLCKAYYQNGIDNMEEQAGKIDQQKMLAFWQGVHYRSKLRAKGVGVKKATKEELKEYYQRVAEENDMGERPVKHIVRSRRRLATGI